LLAAVVGATALTLGFATPASASTWDCLANTLCVFKDTNGGTQLAGIGPGGFFNIGAAGAGDKASSARNRTSSTGVLWDFNSSAGCWNLMLTIAPGAEVNIPAADNDRTDGISVGKNPTNVCNV
jgi:hypothetical protein